MLEKLKSDRKNLRKKLPRNKPRNSLNAVKTLFLRYGRESSILSSPVKKKSCKFSVYKAFLLVLWGLCASGFCTVKGTFSENLATKFATKGQKRFFVIRSMDCFLDSSKDLRYTFFIIASVSHPPRAIISASGIPSE